jgi:hypothetical protein
MVPVDSNNQANVLLPTSATTPPTFNLSVQTNDSSQTTNTVLPTSTSLSPQTMTVTSGGDIGDKSSVQIGLGSVQPSQADKSGLGIDVKPLKNVTVAIHAVTQHYAAAKPLNPGQGTPNQTCVASTNGVLWSTAAGDDQYNGVTINTGPDGVCQTQADPHDAQVIPVGWGIPKDIAPTNVPAAADLQTYLNQVFGTQANVYLTVTRSDFSVNYDVTAPINGILDISEGQGTPPSAEQAVIEDHATSGVTFNIFYVKDYQGIPVSGTAADHSSIGIAYYPRTLAYVRDNTVTLDLTAHEIGHLLNLGHTDDSELPNADSNPACTTIIPDPAASKRLMFPTVSGSNTLLIKPEWDIINHNDGSQ